MVFKTNDWMINSYYVGSTYSQREWWRRNGLRSENTPSRQEWSPRESCEPSKRVLINRWTKCGTKQRKRKHTVYKHAKSEEGTTEREGTDSEWDKMGKWEKLECKVREHIHTTSLCLYNSIKIWEREKEGFGICKWEEIDAMWLFRRHPISRLYTSYIKEDQFTSGIVPIYE